MNDNESVLNEEQQYYFEEAPVGKAIWNMVLPMLISMIAVVLYNMIDGYFIGKLNVTGMIAAVTLTLPLSAFQMAIGNFFGTGGGTYVSRLLGEGNITRAKSASSVSFWMSLFGGIGFAGIALLCLNGLIHLVGATPEVFDYTKTYLSVFVLCSPIIIPTFTMEEIVRSEGASKVAMVGMLSGVLINIIMAPLLIFICHMGLTGAALATVSGNVVTLAIFLKHLSGSKTALSIAPKALDFSQDMLATIAKTGFSAFLLNVFLVVTCLVFNQYAALYGEDFIAAIGISQRCVQLSDFIGMSFAMGSVPLIAYAFAQGNFERMFNIIKTVCFYMCGLTLLIATGLFLFRTEVIGLFTSSASVVAIGAVILLAQLASTLFAALSALLTGIFQAVGAGKPSTIMALARGVIFIPLIMLSHLLWGQTGVIWSMTGSEGLATLIGIVMFLVSFKSGKFKTVVTATL